MRIANKLPNDDNRPQTARKWAACGFIVNEGAVGEEMWTNANCQHRQIYYLPEQVHPANDAELAAFWKPIKAARSAREKERRRLKREKLERDVAPMQEYLDQHKHSKDKITKAVCQAVKNTIRAYKRYQGGVPLFSLFSVDLPSIPDIEPVKSKSITLDTETTGLPPKDHAEILQLSIINQDGDVLFNAYFKPLFTKSWNQAMKIHHITPEMVADQPSIYERLPEILAILQGTERIIGYNTAFDLSMLAASGIAVPSTVLIEDVMQDFAPIYGEWNDYFNSYKWQTLETCAAYFDYDWGQDSAHDSLSDCRATLYCYRKMQELPFAASEAYELP